MAKSKYQLQTLRNARKNTMIDLAQFVIRFLSGVPLVSDKVRNELSHKIENTIIANENLAQAERESYEERIAELERNIERLEAEMDDVRRG